MDPIEDAAPELPPDMWNEIVNFLQEEETLLTMTQVSKGTQDTAEKELTRRWAEQGFLLATGPKELTAALADPEAKVIVTRGGTVDTEPANQNASVIAAGPVAVTGGTVFVRDSIGTITSVSGGVVVASGAAQVSNVTGGRVTASDSAQVTGVNGGKVRARDSAQVTATGDGYVSASDSAQVSNVTGGVVYAWDSAQVTGVSGGEVRAYDDARVTVSGGEVHAFVRASVHSDGATVYVKSPDAAITATGGKIHLPVPNAHIIYSGDVTFYNKYHQQIGPPGTDGA